MEWNYFSHLDQYRRIRSFWHSFYTATLASFCNSHKIKTSTKTVPKSDSSPWTKGRWDPRTVAQGAECAESPRPNISEQVEATADFCIVVLFYVHLSLRLVLKEHLPYVTILYIGHHWSIFWIELKQAQRNSMLKQKRGPTAPHFWFARPKTNQPLAISPDRRFLMRSLLLQANREIAQVHLSLIVMTDGNDSTARGCRLLKYIEVPLQPLPWSPCQLAVSY